MRNFKTEEELYETVSTNYDNTMSVTQQLIKSAQLDVIETIVENIKTDNPNLYEKLQHFFYTT